MNNYSKILNRNNKEFFIGHFQGNVINKNMDIVNSFQYKRFNINSNIEVITIFTDSNHALTAKQLDFNNLSYINAYIPTSEKWTNVYKIKCFLEQLKKTNKEYSLLVDGHDVLFFRDLNNDFIDSFNSYNKDIIFNASKNNYPNMEIDFIQNRDQLGEFKYLNAGIVFGKTSSLLNLYQKAYEISLSTDIANPWQSEQLFIRIASNNDPSIFIDYKSELFQTFAKTKRLTFDDWLIIV